MLLMDLMWSDDERETFVCPIEVRQEDRFILGPSTPSHEDLSWEARCLGNNLSSLSDGLHTVKARITDDLYPRDTSSEE